METLTDSQGIYKLVNITFRASQERPLTGEILQGLALPARSRYVDSML